MIDQLSEQWFSILADGQPEQIESLILNHPHLLQTKQPPLMHTAISVVVKHQIYNKSIEILKVLINKGANPNATNALGQTAIFYAATQSKVHQLKYLLQRGANPYLKDNFGQTVLSYANSLQLHPVTQAIQIHINILQSKNHIEQPQILQKNKTKTYRLCHITSSGQIQRLTTEQFNTLLGNKKSIMQLLRDPKKISKPNKLQNQNWHMVGLKIVDKLWYLSDSVWFQQCAQTWRIPELGPDSPGVDLATIRLKLEHHVYRNPKELRADMNIIWVNCKQRLGELHEMTKHALQLCQNFQHLAREYDYNSYIT